MQKAKRICSSSLFWSCRRAL